jgi:hypothetical protein
MWLLKTIALELLSLFIDDGSLVAVVLVWVLAVAVALRVGFLDPLIGAALLGAGLAALLAENVMRSARTATNKRQR